MQHESNATDSAITGKREVSERYSVTISSDACCVVSYKRLKEESHQGRQAEKTLPNLESLKAHDALEARINPPIDDSQDVGPAAKTEPPLPQPQSRFSSVIERIERLYMGHESDDQENGEDGEGDGDSDEYDTDDSFIDDRELDEYFSAVKSKARHGGFFVNKGDLEKLPEESIPLEAEKNLARKPAAPNPVPKELTEKQPAKVLPSVDLPAVQPVEKKPLSLKSIKEDARKSKSSLKGKAEKQTKSLLGVKKPRSKSSSGKKIAPSLLNQAIADFHKAVQSTVVKPVPKDEMIVESAEASNSQQPKRQRMSKDVMERLSKVVDCAAKDTGTVPDTVISQLLEITRNVMQPLTLKKHVKSLSKPVITFSKQREERLDSEKQRLLVLINSQTVKQAEAPSSLEGKEGVSGAMPGPLVSFQWNREIEDELLQIYTEYFEGQEKISMNDSKRIYSEFSMLWPDNLADASVIKTAIFKARKRQKKKERRVGQSLEVAKPEIKAEVKKTVKKVKPPGEPKKAKLASKAKAQKAVISESLAHSQEAVSDPSEGKPLADVKGEKSLVDVNSQPPPQLDMTAGSSEALHDAVVGNVAAAASTETSEKAPSSM